MRKLLFAIVVLALLVVIAVQTGAAKPLIRAQVESALLESGMSKKRADCMAARMVDRLSIGQLYNLRQAMAPREGEPERADSVGELVKRLRRTGDAEAVAVVTTSAGLCAIGIG